ncbi:MAG: hypothetical protein O3B09_01700 [Proteobacteria bacterium]|nr:hypothetical protein [Pseudomonadota bacterium]
MAGCLIRAVLLIIIIVIALPFLDKGFHIAKDALKDAQEAGEDILKTIKH